jgi:hypothetical protein
LIYIFLNFDVSTIHISRDAKKAIGYISQEARAKDIIWGGWRDSSVVKGLPGSNKALGSIPSTLLPPYKFENHWHIQ